MNNKNRHFCEQIALSDLKRFKTRIGSENLT